MAIYNADRRADIAKMIAQGVKDAQGKPLQPFVDKSYLELAEMLCDQYLASYVEMDNNRKIVKVPVIITV